MKNLIQTIQNYISQLCGFNAQLIRLNKPINNIGKKHITIKTYNKCNVKGNILIKLLYNTIINSPEFTNFSNTYDTYIIDISIPLKGGKHLFLYTYFSSKYKRKDFILFNL
jgi:hypothetical protein